MRNPTQVTTGRQEAVKPKVLAVKSGVKAGALTANHSAIAVKRASGPAAFP